jgi:hypothetical protein
LIKRSIGWLLIIGTGAVLGAWIFNIWTGGCGSTQQEIITTTTTTTTTTSTTLHVKAWGTAERIGSFSNYAFYPQIAMNGNGDALAVWEVWNTPHEIFANHYKAGVGWGTAVAIEPESGNNSMIPQIAIDASGNGIAVWSQYLITGYSYCMANRYTAGSGWGTGISIEAVNGSTAYPQIVMGAGGDAMAVWPKSAVWVNTYTAGSGWGTAVSLEASGGAAEPQIARDTSGNAIIVWQKIDGSKYSIVACRFTPGSGWGAPVSLMNDTGSILAGQQIAVDENGNAIAVWHAYSGSTVRIWASRYTGGSWGSATIIDEDPGNNAYNPQIAMNGSGEAVVVWEQGVEVRSKKYTPGAGWGGLEIAGLGGNPAVAVGETGQAIAVWELLHNIVGKTYSFATGWGETVNLEDSPDFADFPRIAMNRDGKAIAIWQQTNDIWVNRYE